MLMGFLHFFHLFNKLGKIYISLYTSPISVVKLVCANLDIIPVQYPFWEKYFLIR